jgi:hypothetical protein
MKLYHVTDKANLDSINLNGLLKDRAVNKRRAVWAVTRSAVEWAIIHTLQKKRAKGRTLADHVVIELNIPDAWTKRHCRRVHWIPRNIPTTRFARIIEAADLAAEYPH